MSSQELQQSLQDIELRFMEEWHLGQNPSLEKYASQYPQFADELAEFVILFAMSQHSQALDIREITAETHRAVELGLSASRSQAHSLAERLQELDTNPEQLSVRLDLPLTIISWLNQCILVELPRVLVTALARELCQTTAQIRELIEPPQARTSLALHYRATGQPKATITSVRTFKEAMIQCRDSNLASDEQLRKWLTGEEKNHG
mgnify:CR=1 FL=1